MNKSWKGIIIISVIFLILGITLIVVSAMSGGSLERLRGNISVGSSTTEFSQEIDSIDLNVDFGKLSILRGDTFRVEAENIASDYFVCEVRGTTLVIEDKWSSSWSLNLSRGLSFGSYEPRVKVYVPDGVKLNYSKVSVDAGECYIDGLLTARLDVSLSAGKLSAVDVRADEFNSNLAAGECRIDSLITKKAISGVSAGKLTINGLQAEECYVNQSAGSASISGEIKREGGFECGLGQMIVELDGHSGGYAVSLDVGLGTISVNGDSYSGSRGITLGSGDSRISLSCGVGEIVLVTG